MIPFSPLILAPAEARSHRVNDEATEESAEEASADYEATKLGATR